MKQEKPSDLFVGRAGQYRVMSDLLLNNWNVHQSSEGSCHDVIAEKNGYVFRIQVKSTMSARKEYPGYISPYYYYGLRNGKSGNMMYKKKDIDGFAFVAIEKNLICYISIQKLKDRQSLCISDKETSTRSKYDHYQKGRTYFQDNDLSVFFKDSTKNKK